MGRYRKIDPRIWGDEKFKNLSKPQPNGQTLWFYLLTGPHTGGCPGIYHLGEMGLAEALDWPLKQFHKVFEELLAKRLVKADRKAHVLVIFNVFKKYDKPDNPNVIKFWGKCFDEIPECELKVEYYRELKGFVEGLGEPFKKGFEEGFGNTITIPFLNHSIPEPKERETVNPQNDKLKFGEFKNILLTKEEHDKLIKKYGEEWVTKKIEGFSNSLKSQARKYSTYKDHYATLNNWISKDKEENPHPYPLKIKPKESIFAKCPKCGKETTKDDLRKFECCPACHKPTTPENIKSLIGGITGDQP